MRPELGANRIAKNPEANQGDGPDQLGAFAFDRPSEAAWVADRIDALLGVAYDDEDGALGLTPADFAILMRSTGSDEQDGSSRSSAFTRALEGPRHSVHARSRRQRLRTRARRHASGRHGAASRRFAGPRRRARFHPRQGSASVPGCARTGRRRRVRTLGQADPYADRRRAAACVCAPERAGWDRWRCEWTPWWPAPRIPEMDRRDRPDPGDPHPRPTSHPPLLPSPAPTHCRSRGRSAFPTSGSGPSRGRRRGRLAHL